MRSFYSYLLLSLLVFIYSSCKEVKAPDPLLVESISPMSGRHSTVVTITGSGFKSNPAENVVKFNGKEAEVQSATSTQLVVVVPKGAGTGPVTVQNITGPDFTFEYTVVVSTLAGNGGYGLKDGPAVSATFLFPSGVVADSLGNIYVADKGNNCIRKITPAGVVSTLVGSKSYGFIDGDGSIARFSHPSGMAIDQNGNIYVADEYNNAIRKITPSGKVTTLAGSGDFGEKDGQGGSAQFWNPSGITIDASGNLLIADRENSKIRKVTPSGLVSTFAGSIYFGLADGPAASARFYRPNGIAVDDQGNIYVADSRNHCIRKITPTGTVTTFAGSRTQGYLDGAADTAQFNYPIGLAIDKRNNVYVTDSGNNRIRIITPERTVSTLAGNGEGGDGDGEGLSTSFYLPEGITMDKNGVIYIADTFSSKIRKIVLE